MAAKVKRVVAVKKPIARTLWNPRDCARIPRIKAFRYDLISIDGAGIDIVTLTVPAAVYAKIETVEMERMAFESRINPPPMDRFTLRVYEVLGLRPGTTVDHRHLASDKWL